MRLKIGPEFHCLEDEDLKTDKYKKGPEIQYLEG